MTVVIGERAGKVDMLLLASSVSWIVYSSLELMQKETQVLDLLPSHGIPWMGAMTATQYEED